MQQSLVNTCVVPCIPFTAVTSLDVDNVVCRDRRYAILEVEARPPLLHKTHKAMGSRVKINFQSVLPPNLKSVRSHLMKEDFQRFWEYTYPACAGKFLDGWCTRAMRSQIEPMKSMAGTLRKKRELLLNWFHAGGALSSGVVEGFNNKLKLITRIIRIPYAKSLRNRTISHARRST